MTAACFTVLAWTAEEHVEANTQELFHHPSWNCRLLLSQELLIHAEQPMVLEQQPDMAYA